MAFVSRFGRASHALVKEQLREKFAHVSRRIEMTSDAMRTATDRKGNSVEIWHNCEHGFISDVVTDEQRPASPERLMHHQFAHTGRLGETGMLDLADAFAGQYLDWRIGKVSADQGYRFVDRLLRVRGETVMQRQRIALVFEQYSGAELGNGRKPTLQLLVKRRRMNRDRLLAGTEPHLGTMAANGGELVGREDQVDVVERTAADQRRR